MNKDAYLLIPPILAIGLAFITRNVLFSLFMGMLSGALISVGSWSISGAFRAFLRVADHYMVGALSDSNHAGLILFTMTIGGMIAILTQSGGLTKLLEKMIVYANNAVRTQLLMVFTGIAVFFDDYANTIIVGNLYRPLADRFQISREKFSFIVDATAAPVASLSIVSTWIAYELGLIATAVEKLGIEENAYSLFIHSLSHRYYAIFLLVFIFLTILMKKEWGVMWRAEHRARTTGQVNRPDSKPMMSKDVSEWEKNMKHNGTAMMGFLPIFVLLVVVLVGFWISGKQALIDQGVFSDQTKILDIFGAADPVIVLTWGALIATVLAMIMTISKKVFTFDECFDVWLEGVKSMVLPVVILVFAWGLSAVMDELQSGQVLGQMLSSVVSIEFLPALIFILSFMMAFATGTSWGTMAILFPLALPLAHTVMIAQGVPQETFLQILYASIGSILTGAIFGDHISPISDTTIMSSIWSGIDHMDHVQSQMPYALFVGGVSIFLGYVPAGFGVASWITIPLGVLFMAGFLHFKGTSTAEL
ncbi:MAG: hypothetical protein KDD46_04325 [Bdellovibrionales bacterium]|nr:hypothetical protein [Bdellovibrionales bacterium]